MAWDDPLVSFGGMLALGKDRQNSVRILPKKVKSLVIGRKRRCDRSREGRAEVDKEEITKARSSRKRRHDRREPMIEENSC